MIAHELLHDVMIAEGCVLTAYKDKNGFWTIGWGHKLALGHDWTGFKITQAHADDLLVEDLENAQEQARTLLEWSSCATADGCRQNAVVELVFNMGMTHWRGFEQCRRALHNDDWAFASACLLDSKWKREDVPPSRSGRLAMYLQRGTYVP